ncbi:MAG TPA: ribose 5-phosphate isomerase B [Firmicutes bacterium]|nr:ribose 5-phosphate isomerase B [Bacillota bacterium]
MAEAMLRESFRSLSGKGGRDGADIQVISAGLAAPEGEPASRLAVEVMKERNLDISGHRARSITRQLVEDADLILTMTAGHKRSLVAMYPEAEGKVFSMKEFAAGAGGKPGDGDGPGGGGGDIPDPFGGSIEAYRAAADEIGDAVERIISRFKGIESCGARGMVSMRVALGSDHGGYLLKEHLKSILDDMGVVYEDFGTFSEESVDYPDIGLEVARRVARGEFDRGVLICGTGIGMSIAANKIPGIRASLCQDTVTARLAREHNDANVLTLGGRIIGPVVAEEILKVWLSTPFSGGRHARRIEKITLAEGGR